MITKKKTRRTGSRSFSVRASTCCAAAGCRRLCVVYAARAREFVRSRARDKHTTYYICQPYPVLFGSCGAQCTSVETWLQQRSDVCRVVLCAVLCVWCVGRPSRNVPVFWCSRFVAAAAAACRSVSPDRREFIVCCVYQRVRLRTRVPRRPLTLRLCAGAVRVARRT